MLATLAKAGFVFRQVPNVLLLANASIPQTIHDWRANGPWDGFPPFPSTKTLARVGTKNIDAAMKFAYRDDFTSFSTNLFARLA